MIRLRRDRSSDTHRKRPTALAILSNREGPWFCRDCNLCFPRKQLPVVSKLPRCPACGGLMERRPG
jgi:hypothetical protein